jgi:hypothetical protein
VEDPASQPKILYQVVVLDDLIPRDDKRIDLAQGEEVPPPPAPPPPRPGQACACVQHRSGGAAWGGGALAR